VKTLEEIKEIVRTCGGIIASRYGIAVVGVFGSRARNEHNENSDVDLLADVLRPISLLDLVGAELYLSEALGMKVDLVPKRDIRKELMERILGEAVAI
jgi:uncharacterized protein